MKKFKKILCLILVAVMMTGVTFSASTETVYAAKSAKSLISSALRNMKTYDTISYSYSYTGNYNGSIQKRTGMCISDTSIEHGYYLDSSESEKGWEEYTKKNIVYRKGYSASEWTIYKNPNYNSGSIDSYTQKKWIQYLLGHLKEKKIISRGSKTYTITAKPNYKGSDVKKITLTIDKKKECINSIKVTYKNYSAYYLNSANKYTVKNAVETWSNICYGKGKLKLPAGL